MIILVTIVLIQAFMLCWAADLMANSLDLIRKAIPHVPDPDASEAERAEVMAIIDKTIPRLRLIGAWTRPMHGPLRRLHEFTGRLL